VTDAEGMSDVATAAVNIVDTTPPAVLAGSFKYGAAPQTLTITFSEDVSNAISASSVTVRRAGTGDAIVPTAYSWDPLQHAATFVLGALPDGDYQAEIAATGVRDASGNAAVADYATSFFVLAGDANRDRNVDFLDLAKLAQNYNTSGGGKTYADGDFNGDGSVDFLDLAKLAQNYNTALPGAAVPAGSTSFTSDLAAAFALAAPKPTPIPATTRRLPAAKLKPAPIVHPPVMKAPAPVRAAPPLSKANTLVRVAAPIFGNKLIKPRRDVQALFV
jgi:hypothetical protein